MINISNVVEEHPLKIIYRSHDNMNVTNRTCLVLVKD